MHAGGTGMSPAHPVLPRAGMRPRERSSLLRVTDQRGETAPESYKEEKMNFQTCTRVIALALLTMLAIGVQLAAQDNQAHKHHHYKLIDIGTFPGLSIYNRQVTSNGSAVTEFQQILNEQGTLVGERIHRWSILTAASTR